MNKKALILLAIPFLIAGCSKNEEPKGCQTDYSHFQVPEVDVDKLDIKYSSNLEVDTTTGPRVEGDYKIIDIYEMSDTHGSVSYEANETFGLEGFASFMKDRRSENVGGTVVLSSGDMWQGSAESNLTRGKLVTQTMRYIGFDAMTLGNHEFDWTDSVIKKNHDLFSVKPSDPNEFYMPFLCGNLIRKSTGTLPSDIVEEYKIINRGDVKIAIIGTIGNVEDSIIKSAFADYKINPAKQYAHETAKYIKENNLADVVVWSSHQANDTSVGYDDYIDAFFGGHAHKTVCDRDEASKKCRVASCNEAKDVVRIQIKLNKDTNEFVDSSYNVYEASKVPCTPDQNVSSVIAKYKVETDKAATVAVGECVGDLDNESSLANLCCQASYEAVKKDYDSEKAPLVASFVNGAKGVRAKINKGVITYGDVYKAFPFDNEIVTVKVLGLTLKSYFGTGWTWYQTCGTESSIKNYQYYTVVTSDFMATSSNYMGLSEKDLTHTNLVIRDEIARYFSLHCGVNPDDYMGSAFKKPVD